MIYMIWNQIGFESIRHEKNRKITICARPDQLDRPAHYVAIFL